MSCNLNLPALYENGFFQRYFAAAIEVIFVSSSDLWVDLFVRDLFVSSSVGY